MPSVKSICRLCLKVIPDSFEALNACKADMLRIVSLDVNVAVTDKSVICAKCIDSLQQSFEFKMTCLNNEDYLKTFVHYDSTVKLNLKEIIHRSVVEDEIKNEEESVCRLCFKYSGSDSFVKLDDIDDDIFLSDMLHKCLPEIELGITDQPLMCCTCMENLQNQFNFIITCLDNEEKIKDYISANGMNNKTLIDLSHVLQFSEEAQNKDNSIEGDITYIKLENVNDMTDSSCQIIVKKEEFGEVIKDEFHVKNEDNFSLDSQNENEVNRPVEPKQAQSNSATLEPKNLYCCTECPHKTNRKDSLELHYITHKNLPKCELFKCEKCDFTTKWKSSLLKHYQTHLDPSQIIKYKCANCPYESKFKKQLRKHCQKHLNVNNKPFQCEYCTYKTADKWYFKQHNKKKHDKVVTFEDQLFSCNKCHFETAYQSQLSEHKKQVHNIVRYVCDCGYGCQKWDRFQEHTLKHKSREEVTLFRCESCEFQTKYKRVFKNHLKLYKEGEMPQMRCSSKKKN